MKALLATLVLVLLVLPCFSSLSLAQSPISAFNPSILPDSPDGIFFDGRTFWADNALPLRAIFFDKWVGPFNPDAVNWSDNYWKTDAGFVYKGWRLAGFYRGELFMETNKDTVEILRMVNLKEELPTGRVFDVNLKARGFSAVGVELSRGTRLNGITEGLSAGFTVRYLRGEKVQYGEIVGTVMPTGPASYDFNLLLDYVYDENLVYNRRDTKSGVGNGYSFDAGLKYILNEKFNAALLLRDIGGRIHWKYAPYTIADATSAVKSYDEEGYQVYRPTIQGYETYKDFIQEIPLKTDIILSYKRGEVTLTPSINFIEDRPLYWLDLQYKTSEDVSLMFGYNTNYSAFSIGTTYKNYLVDFFLSDIDFSRVNAIGLSLSIWH